MTGSWRWKRLPPGRWLRQRRSVSVPPHASSAATFTGGVHSGKKCRDWERGHPPGVEDAGTDVGPRITRRVSRSSSLGLGAAAALRGETQELRSLCSETQCDGFFKRRYLLILKQS